MKLVSDFSVQLKKLRRRHQITQKQLAEKLSIGQTAVANYENGLRFPDEHMLTEIADYFGVTIDFLMGRGISEPASCRSDMPGEFIYIPSDLATRRKDFMETALRSGREASEMALSFLKAGYSEEQILIDLLTEVQKETGRLWCGGVYNEAIEHQISMSVIESMYLLRASAGTAAPFRGKAVLITVSGEAHNIGLRMLSRLLEIDGWETFFLGSSVPPQSLKNFLAGKQAELLLVSVTLNEYTDSGCGLVRAVKSLEHPPAVIAGGAAAVLNSHDFSDAGADCIAEDVKAAVYWARNLSD